MAKRKTTPARKTTARKKSNSKSSRKKGKKGFSLVRFSGIMIMLVVVGYGVLAIWGDEFLPESLKEKFEEYNPFGDDEEESTNSEPVEGPAEDTSPEVAPEAAPTTRPLDFDSFDLYFTKAFDFGWPAYNTSEAVIERPYYTLRYIEEHEQANWVSYALWADSLRQQTYDRKNDFRKDPRVKTGSAELSDYKGSGFDRGHLAPAGDFSYDEFALSQSFYMSNMSPQNPSFNRGIWKKLEDKVRDWAMENGKVYVVTGPVLNKQFKTIGKNGVSIPEYYYKVVLDIEKPGIKAIAFLMKNEKSSASLESYVVSIDEVERLTGLDFFPGMSDELENALESQKGIAGWF